MTDKQTIRREVLQARDNLTTDQRRQLSMNIRKSFFELPMVARAQWIMLFLAFGSEVDTWLLLDEAVALGKQVVAPVCLPTTKGLALYPIRNREEAEPGHWGIYEPRQVGKPISPNSLDVVVVPGVAFDPDGNRIGYGGGYYDRFLIQVPRAWRIGVCYDLQLIKEVPRADHDVPVDAVVTEAKTILLRKAHERISQARA
ncbi:MAG: 5-formyltetrahydrofolate cyclo-ligase [Firmicutes bacterium]|nr:5-formyltetrahydrofolate cyclo-ligase [Bacillota bacterium]